MLFTQSQINKIIAEASFPFERVNTQFTAIPTSERVLTGRWQTWEKNVSKEDKLLFQKYFQWSNLSLAKAQEMISNVQWQATEAFPDWMEYILLSSEIAHQHSFTSENYPFLDSQKPLPFEELLIPFVLTASQKLREKSDKNYNLLSKDVHIVFEKELLNHLAKLFSNTLFLEFSVKRGARFINWLKITHKKDESGDELYKKFVAEILQDGFVTFFQEYAVLARLTGGLLSNWVNYLNEFLTHLQADWADIQSLYGNNYENSKNPLVIKVYGGFSDMHNKGKFVICLEFQTGLKLVYKPKNLGVDEAYFQFLNWLNKQSNLFSFKCVKILNRSTYGWMEYVETLPCTNIQEVENYYQRAGMLLCIAYLLGSTDLHFENILCAGEQPVFIDTETILTPRIRPTSDPKEKQFDWLITQSFSDSVMGTSLLPQWTPTQDSLFFDASGFGISEEQQMQTKKPQYIHKNKDNMVLEYVEVFKTIDAHGPQLNGQGMSINHFKKYFIGGFQKMYHFFLEYKEVLQDNNSPLNLFWNQPVRFLFRNTQLYTSLLESLWHPDYLRNGVNYYLQLEVLRRSFMTEVNCPLAWQIVKFEQNALLDLNIPHFMVDSCQTVLMPNIYTEQSGEIFAQSCQKQIMLRLEKWGGKDYQQQLDLIKIAFYEPADTSSILNLPNESSAPASLWSNSFEDCALAIGHQICNSAVFLEQNKATWLNLEYNTQIGRYQLKPITFDMYTGQAGIAVFLAGLAKVTQDNFWFEWVEKAIAKLRPENKLSKNPFNTMLGAGVGFGSQIYSLTVISQLLNQPQLLQEAQCLAENINLSWIEQDKTWDVMGGTAGLIIVFCNLFNLTKNTKYLDLGITCAKYLLAKREINPLTNFPLWNNEHFQRPLTGFAHGAAGFAYAFLQLYQLTNYPEFKETAEQCIAYENLFYKPEHHNWLDTRQLDPSSLITSWCYGAPGIGLARLGILPILSNDIILNDINNSLKTVKSYSGNHFDHLCCGEFNFIETLLTASINLKEPELKECAYTKAHSLMQKFQQQNGCFFEEDKNTMFNHYQNSFFRGQSGIGYTLLRLIYPNLLPNVLLWQV